MKLIPISTDFGNSLNDCSTILSNLTILSVCEILLPQQMHIIAHVKIKIIFLMSYIRNYHYMD